MKRSSRCSSYQPLPSPDLLLPPIIRQAGWLVTEVLLVIGLLKKDQKHSTGDLSPPPAPRAQRIALNQTVAHSIYKKTNIIKLISTKVTRLIQALLMHIMGIHLYSNNS